jgi:cell division topological specificity factor
MHWLEYFRSSPKGTAHIAKERLQVVIAHERAERNAPAYLPLLKRDILNAIRKYVRIAEDQVSMQMEQEGDYEILELNITLPEAQKRASGE